MVPLRSLASTLAAFLLTSSTVQCWRCHHRPHSVTGSPISLPRRGVLSLVPSAVSLLSPKLSVAFLFDSKERRQLEYCLVSVMRVVYWAESVADRLSSEDETTRKDAYLQARLGAKAILTAKIGGGASGRIHTLVSMELPACLDDLVYYNRQTIDLRSDFREALAAVVEFDGLETLTDPSPRSSLTLAQYNDSKALFVRRMLRERVIPIGRRLVDSFDVNAVRRAQSYVQQTYANEIPRTPETTADTE